VILGEEYKLRISLLNNFLCSHITSLYFGPHVCSGLFSVITKQLPNHMKILKEEKPLTSKSVPLNGQIYSCIWKHLGSRPVGRRTFGFFFVMTPQQKLRTHCSLKAYCATLWWRLSFFFFFSSNGAPVEWNWQWKTENRLCVSLYLLVAQDQIGSLWFSAKVYFRNVTHNLTSLLQSNQETKKVTFSNCNICVIQIIKHVYNEGLLKWMPCFT
jgi:hypothetical protein